MDAREYQRVLMKIESALFFDEDESQVLEFEGHIKDISEGGIKISIARGEQTSSLENIKEGSSFHFNFYEEYTILGKDASALVNDKAVILRKDIFEDEIVLGCKFEAPSQELIKYVTDLKTNSFYNALTSNML